MTLYSSYICRICTAVFQLHECCRFKDSVECPTCVRKDFVGVLCPCGTKLPDIVQVINEGSVIGFEAFSKASQSATPMHVTSVGIIYEGRRFWSKKLARYVGKRGKRIRYFLEVGGPLGDCCVAFTVAGTFICNTYEVGAKEVLK